MATPPPPTKLDRVRPTVVVRRRVVDAPVAPHGSIHVDDDEGGPPSSVNVARALKALRADEVQRLEEILSAQDEAERAMAAAALAAAAPLPPPAPSVPTVRLGRAIALAELARRMHVSDQEIVTTLVTRGFFSVTVKTVLPRELARVAAETYGWQVEEHDDEEQEEAKPPKGAKRTKANANANANAKARAKANANANANANAKAKAKANAKKPAAGAKVTAKARSQPSGRKKSPLRRSS